MHAQPSFPTPLQCGMADSELRGGHPALACARLQEALHLLADAPHAGGSAGGGGLLPRLGGGGAAGGGAPRVLAPRLQADIQAALAQYHPDAVADYLQVCARWLAVCLVCSTTPCTCGGGYLEGEKGVSV